MILSLLVPDRAHLPAYQAALARGWSPNTTHDVSAKQLAAIEADPNAFIADLLRQGGPHELPDGKIVERLPHRTYWLWDGDFCGAINIRWQAGTDALPKHVLGHIGYSVVPWKQRRGIATEALRQLLHEAPGIGLSRVEITTEAANIGSRKAIEANGGRLAGTHPNPHGHGDGAEKLLYVVEFPR